MKKFVLPFFSLLLVITLALSSFSSVTAAGGDPWVTPVSGDMDFTATVVPIASLPGVTKLANQMLVPKGFPTGEAQFGGNGVRVTGLEAGKATACFSLSALEVSKGWGGKVGMWDGTRWVLLPTAIAPVAKEASSTSACAGITDNGTYAFIKYIAEPELLPKGLPACGVMTFAGPWEYDFGNFDGWMSEGLIYNDPIVPIGTSISYQILNVVPSGFFTSGTTGSGLVTRIDEPVPGVFISIVTFDPQVVFEYDHWASLDSFILRINLPECYTDFHYPEDLFSVNT
jgi:hypothetical protein